MAEVVVENFGAEARTATSVRLFGAVLERGYAGTSRWEASARCGSGA